MPTEAFTSGSLRSAAFRFALLLAVIFATGSFALLLTVQQQIGSYAAEATNGRIKAELSILAAEYRQLGLSGLMDAMERHREAGPDSQFRYLLLGGKGQRLFGDLPAIAARQGWGTVEMVENGTDPSAAKESLTTLTRRLPDGLILTVASDNYDVQDLRDRLGRFTLWSGAAITLFALLGGYICGRLFLRRLRSVNQAVDRIIDGNSAERLPMIGFGPEFDELAGNLNRMLDRNAAAMEALRQVSTDIAHDLRTPLTRLHQGLEEMQEVGHNPELVDRALAQTTGLLETFHALLRIGTVEGGVGRRHFRRVDLSELMDRIQQAYEPVAEDAGHVLRADHAPDVMVEGDAELLAQLFTNLIENAIVHTPAGTVITSHLTMMDGLPVAEVRDTGPGVPEDERQNVFRRFYRLDASRHGDGAGLGLSLVAAIASLHGADHAIIPADGLCVRITFRTLR